MKLLQLPKNKVARFFINIFAAFIWIFPYYQLKWIWLDLTHNIVYKAGLGQVFFISYIFPIFVYFIPVALATRYIWFGRIKPRPKITKSKD